MPNDLLKPESLTPHDFLLPDLGEGLTEAEIVTWLVKPGDVIAIDQAVVEVESAKSVVELPSPFGGRVVTLHAAAGEVVHKGSPLITVVPVGAELSADAAVPWSPAPVSPTAPVVGSPADSGMAAGSGAVLVGYGTSESTVRLKRPAGGRFGARTLASASAPATALLDPNRRSPVVSPLVRKRAKSHGFDASQLIGSGPDSLVLRDDVEAAIAALAAQTRPRRLRRVGDRHRRIRRPPRARDCRVGVRGHRPRRAGRRAAPRHRRPAHPDHRPAQGRGRAPEPVAPGDSRGDDLARRRRDRAVHGQDRLQKSTGERFSLTALIARFVVAGLRQYPILNSSLSADGQAIIQHGASTSGWLRRRRAG